MGGDMGEHKGKVSVVHKIELFTVYNRADFCITIETRGCSLMFRLKLHLALTILINSPRTQHTDHEAVKMHERNATFSLINFNLY